MELYNKEGKQLSAEEALEAIFTQGLIPFPKITRIEVLDTVKDRYTNWEAHNQIELDLQDEGRTLKVFVNYTTE